MAYITSPRLRDCSTMSSFASDLICPSRNYRATPDFIKSNLIVGLDMRPESLCGKVHAIRSQYKRVLIWEKFRVLRYLAWLI